MSDCPRSRWPWLACKFEPRYSETEDETMPFEPEEAIGEDYSDILVAAKLSKWTRTYICDVCTRCGKVVDNRVKHPEIGRGEET